MDKWVQLRIGLFSDLHYSIDSQPEEHKWFPAVYDLLSRINISWAEKFLGFWDKLTQRWAAVTLKKMGGQKVDFFINLGDTTPGIDEEGLITNKAVWQAREALKRIQSFTNEKPVYHVPGNHDIGYFSNFPGAQRKGPSDISCQNHEALFGPVWQTKVVKGIRLVFLYSYPLIRPESEFEDQPYLRKIKKDQEMFLKYKLAETTEPLILFLHDPLALLKIYPRLKPFQYRLICVVAGHVHSSLLGRLLKWRYKELRELKAVVVPSPWGWCGIGKKGRGMVLEVESDDSIRVKIV